MKGLLAWFAHNAVAANLLMAFLLLGGIAFVGRTNAEILPQIDPRVVSLQVSYPGATPEDVEVAITRRVEEAVLGLEGVDRVRSAASEGLGRVTIELEDFADAQAVRDEVQSAVERLRDFPPEEAEAPEITIARAVSPVARLVVTGDVSEQALKQAAVRVERALLATDGISIVNLQGAKPDEIAIEVAQDTLDQYNLTVDQVAAAVRAASVNLSAGAVQTTGGDVLLRANTEARDAEAFARIVVAGDVDGRALYLEDIATIRDGLTEDLLVNTYNGQPAVFVQVERSADEDAFAVREAVGGLLADYRAEPGIDVLLTADVTEAINDRMNLLGRNGMLGLSLVFVFLALTLDLRLAFWTCVGIPIAFLGGMMLFSQWVTINMVTLMGLILVLGIVVDDAIVVGENIFEAQSRTDVGPASAVAGARGVLTPVSIGVLTSMIAFATLLQLSGVLGQLLKPVPIVVLSVLLISLVEVFLVLPAHLAHGSDWSVGVMQKLKQRVQSAMTGFRERFVVPAVRACTRYPQVVIAACLACLVAFAGLINGGHVRFVFFPQVEGDSVTLTLEMPSGTPFERTEAAMDRVIEAAVIALGGPNAGVYRAMTVTVGGRLASGFNARSNLPEPEVAVATLDLVPSEERSLSSSQIERRWRQEVGELPGVERLSFESAGLSGGEDIEIQLSGASPDRVVAASEALADALRQLDGVAEIQSSNEIGKRQIEFELTPAGIAAGLTVGDLARHMRNAYLGEEVQRFQRGREEVRVLVRLPQDERQRLTDLRDIRVPLPSGGEVPLETVARMMNSRSDTRIERIDGLRVVTVSADVDERVTTPVAVQSIIAAQVLPELVAQYADVSAAFDGQSRDQSDDLGSLGRNFLIATLAIYVLLASILRSYWQPLIIIAIIPFGFVGAVLGHLLLGYDLTFLSLFGVVALSGVIINDSIVLLDCFNQLQRQGGALADNIVSAARRRFRPILLTTLTTFIGLAPMIAETSMQAQFLIPMALSLAFGIIVASAVILLLVPALLALRGRRATSPAPAPVQAAA
ncbi:MAG: efflux RND transporter permease subunit [Pseudomonadota bacterium]